MQITIKSQYAIVQEVAIQNAQDALDLIGSISYQHQSKGIILRKEALPEDFFELRTGLAGDILQKFTNYSMMLAIVGDFSGYDSKSLRDFIYESNKAGRYLFVATEEEALAFWNE